MRPTDLRSAKMSCQDDSCIRTTHNSACVDAGAYGLLDEAQCTSYGCRMNSEWRSLHNTQRLQSQAVPLGCLYACPWASP
jgi:hypothetical protein